MNSLRKYVKASNFKIGKGVLCIGVHVPPIEPQREKTGS